MAAEQTPGEISLASLILPLYLPTLCIMFGYGMIVPVLPLFARIPDRGGQGGKDPGCYGRKRDHHSRPFGTEARAEDIREPESRGVSFNLDFHTIPFHGEDALVEKHYVTKRSRRQKGILVFLVEDAEKRVFC